MPTVTKDNVGEYQDYIDTLYTGLTGLRDGALSSAIVNSLKANFDECAPSDWSDEVGAAFKARVEECAGYMETTGHYNDSQLNRMVTCAYNMKTYADEVVRLIASRSEYARWRSNLNKESDNYKTKYDNYTSQINNCDYHITENLKLLNAEIAKLPGFHFELSDNYSPDSAGDSGGGDTGSDSGDGTENAAAQRQAAQNARENTHFTIYYKDMAYHRNPNTGAQYGDPYEVQVEREVTYVKDGDGNYKVVVNEYTRDSQGNKVGYDGNVPVPGELTNQSYDWNQDCDVRMVTATVDGVTYEYPCAFYKDSDTPAFVPPHTEGLPN